MRCPWCGSEEKPIQGKCGHCGYRMVGRRTVSLADPASWSDARSPSPLILGDNLNRGRYRLLNQIILPETQHRQGLAWLAIDTKDLNRRMVIREMVVPKELAKGSSVDQLCYTAAQRLMIVGQYAGLPSVSNFFNERNAYFIVLRYPEGVSLASMLKRHGGALPEHLVATYGYQLCGLLTLLVNQQPPLVHGSINPETIFINENQHTATLIHLPLFVPDAPPNGSEQASAGYYAPEQVRGETSPSADLYGLAVTMHHMVTGYDPRTRLALFHPPARRLNPAVTKQMELILARQLSLSTTQRYSHPAEMQKDLAALIAAYPDASDNATPAIGADPFQIRDEKPLNQNRNTLLLNMGVFAAICILLLVGILLAVLH